MQAYVKQLLKNLVLHEEIKRFFPEANKEGICILGNSRVAVPARALRLQARAPEAYLQQNKVGSLYL
jgi:hypothetical protein